MIKLFADTASLNEISHCFSKDVNDGITTNPKIIESTGDLSIGFEGACRKILAQYPSVPVSLETDFGGMSTLEVHSSPGRVRDLLLEQADRLYSWGGNVVVKIPICEGGLLATKILSQKGIRTNVTACMNPYQAMQAAEAGATYVSLFANRMLDSHILTLAGHSLDEILEGDEWKGVVKSNQHHAEKAWDLTLQQIGYVAEQLEGSKSELIVGSIRSPTDMTRIAQAAPQIITVPYKIVERMIDIPVIKNQSRVICGEKALLGDSLLHPMTDYTLAEFEKAAESYRGK